jgi:hypothetical protein
VAAAVIWLAIFAALVILTITNRIGRATYVAKVLLAFDYFMCVLWTRDQGLSISGRCGLYWRHGNPPVFWYLLHRLLNALQKDHCELAIEGDLARAQAVVRLLAP